MATGPYTDPFGILAAENAGPPQNGNPQSPAKPNSYVGTGLEPPATGTLTNAIRALPNSISKASALSVLKEHYEFAKSQTDATYLDPFKRKYQKQAQKDIESTYDNAVKAMNGWTTGPFIRSSAEFNFLSSTIGRLYGNISALTDQVKIVSAAQADAAATVAKAAEFSLFGLSGISLIALLVIAFIASLPFLLQAKSGFKELFK